MRNITLVHRLDLFEFVKHADNLGPNCRLKCSKTKIIGNSKITCPPLSVVGSEAHEVPGRIEWFSRSPNFPP